MVIVPDPKLKPSTGYKAINHGSMAPESRSSQVDIDMESVAEESSPANTMPRAAKVGHKKSRLGCQRCKTRRVKCDEQKPACGSCIRHGAECVYIEMKPILSPHDSSESTRPFRRASHLTVHRSKSPSPTAELFPRQITEKEDPEIPESKARRLMELRLMQNMLLNMASGFQHVHDEWTRLWQNVVPQMALEHDNVLYSQFALSATNLLRENAEDEALYSARQNYFVLALREQRKACAHIHAGNAEAVCLTSVLILHASFAMLQERSIDQYTPPIEWLKMGRGAGAVMWKANTAVSPEMPVSFKIFLDTYQHVLTEQQTQVNLDEPFSSAFAAITEHETNTIVRDVYYRTLAYINSMQNAIDNGEHSYVVSRRLQAFPMIIPTRFVDHVESRKCCALVILAHYFGTAAQIDGEFWWLRGPNNDRLAIREIQGISNFLGEEASLLMAWPMSKAGLAA